MTQPTPRPEWKKIESLGLEDVRYEKWNVEERLRAFDDARDDETIGAVILTGDGDQAFCSGGDQRVRGTGGYVGGDGIPCLDVLDEWKRLP